MEAIHAAIAKHGNVWSLATNTEMNALYEPLHAARASGFADTVRVEKGLKYGTDARHRIDVYRSVATTSENSLPVVVFFHGGGFTGGDNDISPYMHGNIGNYFASNDCVCFLGTYRLLPDARYPSGGEDTAAALQWVQEHAGSYGGDSTRITAVGQSSGGAHLASSVFGGHMRAAGVQLAGLVLLSPPLTYDLSQERRRKNMLLYHDATSDDAVMSKTGVALFQGAAEEDLAELRLLLMVAELDSNEIVNGNLAFVDAYRKRSRRLPQLEVMQGHNHISNTLAIGLPGDAVGQRILRFAKSEAETI